MSIEIQVGLLTGFFAIIGGITILVFQNRYRKRERKEIEFSKLAGLKIWRKQLYISRFEAYIYSDYHEFRNKLKSNSLDLSEAIRWMQKSEELALEIAKANQKFLESLGIISVLFPKSKELKNLVEENYRFKSPSITRPSEKMTLDQLKVFKSVTVNKLNKLVEREYGEKVDKLLEILKNYL